MSLLHLHLPDDDPRGLRHLSIEGQSVQALHIPRRLLKRALDEWGSLLSGVGVYYLVRQNDEDERPRVYIGQTQDFEQRFKAHNVKKEFWTHALVVLDRQFDTVKVMYLEWLSEATAREADRYVLENSAVPSKPKLGRPMESELRKTFATVETLLTILGAPLFEPYSVARKDPPLPQPSADGAPAPPARTPVAPPAELPAASVLYVCDGRGARASARYGADGLTVLAGSVLSEDVTRSGVQLRADEDRQALIQSSDLVAKGGRLVLANDYTFKAPSRASNFVMGSSTNGWKEWKQSDGTPLGALRAAPPS